MFITILNQREVSQTQKHLICVLTVETLIYILETLAYMFQKHINVFTLYMHRNTYETHNKLHFICFKTLIFRPK